ncbi:RnfABCDGE type electron transport complex subunit G [Ohessyouella blattaphilus]|uniref:Ion-translocating oxidoreductase complex subunit G n=1 Tax=Ohessyouella blattaphilus TaxID=2949333 RepID=A0ABT1EF14_9FIRM|nr:RnfABCDGE type electron transport complex subunit G [Ohessyouella blattaphilus]MCP1109298.1 RnfABCDGE type electron transport complex subunit G [Ohessyouella blattaphilus]MCR8562692.1 RnfABCDGE type electron transport complex subunit G [Ohessyouella blattaphilus]
MKMMKNTIILTLITVIAGAALGLVYEITKEPIAIATENAKKAAWQEVFPEAAAADFEVLSVDKAGEDAVKEALPDITVNEVCKAGDKGYVVTTTSKAGYGGDIKVTVGVTTEGTVSGVSFLEISETAGLGMKAKEESFYGQYIGKGAEGFAVSKDGGSGEPIDAISGATITSRAVTEAVNAALVYAQAGF